MSSSNKITSLDAFVETIKSWQQQGEKIVFTNGCFDILHLGHIDYLEKAREKGDRLVVGLNTDASVRKLKGTSRPVNAEYARARIMAALSFVDLVTLFEEDTPYDLIKACMPDVLVKGNDYTIDTIVGADIVLAKGGSVETISLVDGYSTTGIIEKLKKD